MEGGGHTHKQDDGSCENSSILLELSAVDDLVSFKHAVEEQGHDVDQSSSWYGRRIGSKKMGFEERTPLMIAAMIGSKDVLSYILQTGCVDVNRSCGSDGATALHCAAASGNCRSHEIVKLLLDASADINRVDANGSRPCDVIALCPNTCTTKSGKILETMLKGGADDHQEPSEDNGPDFLKEYPPDMKNGIYITDEFRMYTFKVKPCPRAYSHDWTECPFVHPGENARRRDPRKYHYSCVPCPEFRKASSCFKGDACEYEHGIFECWLHPSQYRTRLCKDEKNCKRRVCFFAHKPEEIRPSYSSTGSAVPSPRSTPSMPSSPMWQNQLNVITPPSLQLPGIKLRTALNARNAVFEAELLGIENQTRMHRLEGLSSPSRWRLGGGLNDAFACDAFAKRSQSFIDRGAVNRFSGLSSPSPSPNVMPSRLSDWGSPDGKLDWGIKGEELNKLRKSASFGVRSAGHTNVASGADSMGTSFGIKEKLKQRQLYMEQEQMVA